MKQIIQSFKTGQTILEDIPTPVVGKGELLIQTTRSLVSLGTERMLVEFGKASLVSKARQQPERVKQVLDKIKTDGLLPTLEAVFNKLEQPLPLGYCNVGRVVEIGEGVASFQVGDRVASNGHHAEVVCVPQNLVAKIPDSVSDEEAAFTVVGSIGLQGIRLINPTLGETLVVTGLGLIGLLTAQLLQANGCRVIGLDFDETKLKLAKSWGIVTCNPSDTDVVQFVHEQTHGIGADGVIITASAKTDEVISEAARMSRKRGRIVLVGVVGLNLNRSEFYEKELTFQVSCSYGPGRYDETYEQKGFDYPLPFVRWTEKRNFEAVLQALSLRQLKTDGMITERIPLQDYLKIYGSIGQSRSIASLLVYPENQGTPARTVILSQAPNFNRSKGVVGLIGAGNFAKMTLLPAIKGTGAHFKYIASAGGVTGTALAKKYGFSHSTTDYREILNDPEVDIVLITTRHHLHAAQVIETLQACKHVFVEKPLALNNEQLSGIIEAYNHAQKQFPGVSIHVGFNRRFSSHLVAIKKALGQGPLNIVATMNAGYIPPNAWVHDLKIGGGRIIGEACHFIDLCVFLTMSKVSGVFMNSLGQTPEENTDNASIVLKFEDGSNAVVNYFSNGNKGYSKERLEVFSQGRTIVMDNFRKTKAYGFKGFRGYRSAQDKGHKAQFHALIQRIQQGGDPLIPFENLINTTQASFAAIQSMKEGKWISIG